MGYFHMFFLCLMRFEIIIKTAIFIKFKKLPYEKQCWCAVNYTGFELVSLGLDGRDGIQVSKLTNFTAQYLI